MTTAARAPHVVVVGGGIAGLAAAAALRARSPVPLRITVLEGSPALGGKLALTEVAGVVTDAGAEALLARRPEALALARSVGLGDDLEDPASSGASLWTRGALRPLPSGQLMGVPGDLRALRRERCRVDRRPRPGAARPCPAAYAGRRRVDR